MMHPMVTTKPILAAVTLLLTPSLCLAWGADGHRIVGEIAGHYLMPEVKSALETLPRDQTLADVSAWADATSTSASPMHSH